MGEAMSGDRMFGRRLALALLRAARGLELPEEAAPLNDACAVFTETEDVGGPEANIERRGGSN